VVSLLGLSFLLVRSGPCGALALPSCPPPQAACRSHTLSLLLHTLNPPKKDDNHGSPYSPGPLRLALCVHGKSP
jgi:hypothetical protein